MPRVLQLKPGAEGRTLGRLLLLAPAHPWQLLVGQLWCPRCVLGGHRALLMGGGALRDCHCCPCLQGDPQHLADPRGTHRVHGSLGSPRARAVGSGERPELGRGAQVERQRNRGVPGNNNARSQPPPALASLLAFPNCCRLWLKWHLRHLLSLPHSVGAAVTPGPACLISRRLAGPQGQEGDGPGAGPGLPS